MSLPYPASSYRLAVIDPTGRVHREYGPATDPASHDAVSAWKEAPCSPRA